MLISFDVGSTPQQSGEDSDFEFGLVDNAESTALLSQPTEVSYSYANSRADISQLDSASKKRARHRTLSSSIDTLELFLTDVAQLPIIHGRHDYIPLVRRIMCRAYCVIPTTNTNFAWELYQAACVAANEFNETVRNLGHPPLDLKALSQQVDLYLDARDHVIPPALAASIGSLPSDGSDDAAWAHVEKGWRCLHLLALLPRFLRTLDSDYIDPIAVLVHAKPLLEVADSARQRLLEGTLRYVFNIAQGYIGRGVPYEDLVQDGFFGLAKAVLSYREYLGIHFQHYAATWIHQSIGRSISETRSLIRLPIHAQEKLREFVQKIEAYLDVHGKLPEPKHLVTPEYGDTAIRKFLTWYNMAYAPSISLETSVLPQYGTDDPPIPIAELLYTPDRTHLTAENAILKSDIEEILATYLSHRERDIVERRIGLGTRDEQTLEEIGTHFGVTRERIRQLEAKSLRKLKHPSCNYRLKEMHSGSDAVLSMDEEALNKLLVHGLKAHDLQWHPDVINTERRRVRRLVVQYVERARKGRGLQGAGSTRAIQLESALRSLGRPSHYRSIYSKCADQLGRTPPFDLKQSYATMFYSERFKLCGSGVFDLVGEATSLVGPNGERLFTTCPEPLLPSNSHPRALLESLLMVIALVQQQPSIVARNVYTHILDWTARSDVRQPQAAFDVWYAAGIIEYASYETAKHSPLILTVPGGMSVNALRQYCLLNVCKRIAKLDYLFVALSQLPRQSVTGIQQMLFGDDQGGADLHQRLAFLAAFDGIREESGFWYVTGLGRQVCGLLNDVEVPAFVLAGERSDVSVDFDSTVNELSEQFSLFEHDYF